MEEADIPLSQLFSPKKWIYRDAPFSRIDGYDIYERIDVHPRGTQAGDADSTPVEDVQVIDEGAPTPDAVGDPGVFIE